MLVGRVGVLVGTCGSSCRIVSIFSVQEQSRSRAESEDRGGGAGRLRKEEKIWHYSSRIVSGLGTCPMIEGQHEGHT